MALALSDIIAKSRKFINEYIGGQDEFSEETDELLRAHADVAAKVVAKVAPLRFLTVTTHSTNITGEERPDGRKLLRIEPGSDIPVWLRIVEIRVSGLVPIRTILTSDDAMYAMEWTKQKGVGSGSVRPRAYSPLGDVDMIEVHSVTDDGAVAVDVSMVEMPSPTRGGREESAELYENLSEELLDAVAGQTAALYLSAIGDEKAGALSALAQAMMTTLRMETAEVDN